MPDLFSHTLEPRAPRPYTVETFKQAPGRAAAPAASRGGPVFHPCHCGKWGAYGYGPPLRMRLEWFCEDHRPSAETVASWRRV